MFSRSRYADDVAWLRAQLERALEDVRGERARNAELVRMVVEMRRDGFTDPAEARAMVVPAAAAAREESFPPAVQLELEQWRGDPVMFAHLSRQAEQLLRAVPDGIEQKDQWVAERLRAGDPVLEW